MQKATILLTGLPELQPVPFGEWLEIRLAQIFNFLRYGFENVVEEIRFVTPLLFAAIIGMGRVSLRGARQLFHFFPAEYWAGGLLVLLTVVLLLI